MVLSVRLIVPGLINGIRAGTTRKKLTVTSFLPPNTVQHVIDDMEKLFVRTDSVPKGVQYASSFLKHILEERDAESRKVREALAELDIAICQPDEDNTKEM